MQYLPYKTKEPSITLDELLKFLQFISHLDINSNNNHLVWKKSGDGYQFNSEEHIELFRIMLIAHLENVITIEIEKPGNDDGRPFPELEKFMKFIEEEDNRSLITRTLSPNGRIGEKYSIFILYMNFELFKESIKRKSDGLYGKITINCYQLLELLFRKITEHKGIIGSHKGPSIERLGEMIYNKTQGNPDFEGEITIRYNFEEYLEKERSILPFLDTLEEKNILRIKQIRLKDKELSFVLDKFRECTRKIFKNPADKKVPKEKPSSDKKAMNKETPKPEFSFNENTGDLIYGGIKPHRFTKGSDRYIIMQMAFNVNKFEHIDFVDVIEEIERKELSEIKDFDTKKKNLNTTILDIRKNVIEEKYNVKEFFQVENRAYYRQY